jgi:hypothetical protein
MVAAAVIGGAVVGAAGSAVAGSEAAGATTSASNNAIAQQRSALAQQTALEAPYNAIGTNAIPTYQSLLGLGPQGSAGIESTLQSLPGYQFSKQQGLTGTTNAATASGLSLSGNTLQALDQYSTGLADSTYQSELGNLQGAVGIGQAAASGQSANIGNTSNNISNATIAQGNNIAGIDANTIAGITKATSNGVNQYQTNQTLSDIYGSGGLNANGSFTPTFDASLGSAVGASGNTPINTSLVTPS